MMEVVMVSILTSLVTFCLPVYLPQEWACTTSEKVIFHLLFFLVLFVLYFNGFEPRAVVTLSQYDMFVTVGCTVI